MNKNVACIVLAAGRGERMKSGLTKVLHPLCGRPLVGYVMDLLKSLKVSPVIVVLGHQHQQVRRALPQGTRMVIQKKLLGTADAVKQALPVLRGFKGTVIVLYADNPLVTGESVKNLIRFHAAHSLASTILTADMEHPQGYGRIERDTYGSVRGIVEEKDAHEFQKGIKEINSGIMCFDIKKLQEALPLVRSNNRKKEYYLTDVVSILYKKGYPLDTVRLANNDEARGINARGDLAFAQKIMQRRIHEVFMQQGVSIVDPDTTFISYGVKIGVDTVIYPFTVIERNVTIGRHCSVGPFAHLREGSRIKDDVVVGNFSEIVRSTISSHTLLKHFGYIGDSYVGRRVNIGAGTVVANFDGTRKHRTSIRDGSFIGSDSVLIAPVCIGKSSTVGAGAVVTKHVPPHTVVVGVPARPLRKKEKRNG